MANKNITQLTPQTGSADPTTLLYSVVGGTSDRSLPLTVLFNNPTFTGTVTIPFTQIGSTYLRTVQQKLQETKSVLDFGADNTGTADSTAAVQNCINEIQALGGGIVLFPSGTYKISGTLSITANNVTLQGQNKQGTIILFNNGTSDCISVVGASYASQLYGFELKNLYLNHTGKTGGRTLVFAYVSQLIVRDVTVNNAWTGAEVWVSNNVVFDNVVINGVTGGASVPGTYYGTVAPQACYGLWWHAPGDNSARCDQLSTLFTTIQALNSGADGFVWDGLAQTWNAFQTTALGCRYGLHIMNSAASGSYFPGFGEFDNFNTENISSIGTFIEGGRTFQFVNCNLNNTSGGSGGSADTNAFRVNPDTGNSFTSDIYIANSRIGQSKQGALYLNARDVMVVECTVVTGATTTANTYPAVEIGANAVDVKLTTVKTSQYGASNNWKYGAQIDSGATRVTLTDVNYYSAQTSSINDLSGNAIILGGVDLAGRAMGPYLSDSGTGGIKSLNFVNAGTTSSTQARVQLVTGSSNAYTILGLTDGTTPTFLLSTGSGVTGGINFAPGAGGVTVTGTLSVTSSFTPSTTAGIVGTTTANNANAGSVGEVITSSATAVALTSATAANITSISLTAGDWDISGTVKFNPAGTTTMTGEAGGISTTSATFGGLGTYFSLSGFTSSAGNGSAFSTPTTRINVSATTTVYLIGQGTFATSTCTADGLIRARRVR